MIRQSVQLRSHQFRASEPGPHLIVTGAVHGNETCGTEAIRQVISDFDAGELVLSKGCLTLLPITNPLAYAQGTRAGERNLNRNLKPRKEPRNYEDRVANALCPLLEQNDVLLDLHSFQGQGEPFALIGPQNNQDKLQPFDKAIPEQLMAAYLGPKRVVEGWMSVYQLGTSRRRKENPNAPNNLIDVDYGKGTTEYMRSTGGYAVTVECGQHLDPEAPKRGVYAIRQTLALLQMVDFNPQPPTQQHQVLRLIDVIDRNSSEDRFVKEWKSFDPVREGEVIGLRKDGREVRADKEGFVVFPNKKAAVGHEWFYLAKISQRALIDEGATNRS